MATSGTTTVRVTDWDSLQFTWNLSSQSTVNNTSTVTWALKLVATSSGRIDSTASKNWSVTVNGTNYSGTNTVKISNNSTKTLASGTTVIKHNDDGTKSFNYSFSQNFGITFSGSTIGTISGSGSGTLTTIARASQPSCITWPEHTQNVGDFGATISIHMNRKSSSFTHTVRYAFGSQTGTIATGVTTGTTWTIPLSLMNLIPNAQKGSGTIYADTYNGSTKIGTKSCGFTATVPTTVKPSCTVAVTDSTGLASTYGNPVKGLSKFRVVVTPTLAYTSPIKGYNVTANGSKYTQGTFTTDFLKSSGTLTVSASVTDGRGAVSATATRSMTVLDYTPPVVSKLTTLRCNQNGTENPQGEYISVGFSASCTALNNKNTATYTLKYKKSTETNFTTVALTALQNQYTVTNQQHIFQADSGASYDIEFSAVDKHNTTTRSTTAPTAFVIAHFGADGKSVGLGKISERSGWLENNFPTENLQSVVQIGNRYSFSSPGISNTVGFVKMAEITVTAANADTPMTFVFTRRRGIAPMTVHIQFANSAGVVATVTSITYEGSNYGAFLNSSDGTVWGLYVQKDSAWDTLTLQDWWMSRPMEGCVKVTFPGTLVDAVPTPFHRATPFKMQSILDFVYPVNSIYINYSHTSPATLFGGTWVRITNAFLWACDADGEIGITGGSRTHTLTANELPKHTHPVSVANTATGTTAASNKIRFNNNASSFVGTVATDETGGGQAHNNMPPYIQVSVWRRTA